MDYKVEIAQRRHVRQAMLGTLRNDQDVNESEKYKFAFIKTFPTIPTLFTSKMRSNCTGI